MTRHSAHDWAVSLAASAAALAMIATVPISAAQAAPNGTTAAMSAAMAKKAQVGKLTVKVHGLPKGGKAKVKVTGPGYKKTVAKTMTLSALKPGSYRVSAAKVSVNGNKYKATVSPKAKVTVKKNKVAKVRVRHVRVQPPTPPTGTGTTPPSQSAPLRFNLTHAAGVAVPATGARASTPSTGAPLLAVAPDGSMTSAVAEGQVPEGMYLASTYPGPGKKLAIVYGGLPRYSTSPTWCVLGLVDGRTGDHTCLETYRPNFYLDGERGPTANGFPNVQFDAQGRVYYRAHEMTNGPTSTGPSKYIIRRHDGVTATDLVGYGNVYIHGWIVASDGTVVVSGSTNSNGQRWTRAISPAGAIQGLPFAGEPLPAQFPDGNVYLRWYDYSIGNDRGIRRYLVQEGSLEQAMWMGPSERNPLDTIWDTSAFCEGAMSTLYCGAYAVSRQVVTTGNAEVWALSDGKVLRLYPSPAVADFDMNPGVLASVGNRIAASGTDPAGNQVTTLYDPANGAKKTLLGPDNQVEVFSLNWVASSGLIMFDGVRYSDGKYVVGMIDPNTGSVSMDAASKMSQVVTFDE